MSVMTQGTNIYFIDPADSTVVKLEGVTTFNPGGAPADQIEDTPLESDVRTYRRGLRTPGQASMTVNADPTKASHVRLHELSEDQTVDNIKWVVGWADGTADPTVTTGDWTLPTTRTWFAFDGYVADFPLDFSSNTVVTSQVSIQRTGGSVWTKKV